MIKPCPAGCDGTGWRLIIHERHFTVRVKVQCRHGRFTGLSEPYPEGVRNGVTK